MPKKTAKEPNNSKKKRHTNSKSIGRVILQSALDLARQCHLKTLLLYVDGLENINELESIDVDSSLQVILIPQDNRTYEQILADGKKVVCLTKVQLTRMGQIKMAVMLSFSKRLLKPQDRFVYLTGLERGNLDTMMIMEIGREYEMFQSVDQPPLTEHIRRAVFERVFSLALELAAEGREGKPIGAIFILGDSEQVIQNAQQNIINPFKGYPEKVRNILDPKMTETVKEFATIDGAFIIKGAGAIVSAGTFLLPRLVAEDLPQGLGARHAAAAAITAATKSVAITISESTGTVRIWRQGKLITEIEKAKRSTAPPNEFLNEPRPPALL